MKVERSRASGPGEPITSRDPATEGEGEPSPFTLQPSTPIQPSAFSLQPSTPQAWLSYVPPEWVLLVGSDTMTDLADRAIQAEDTNVRRTDTAERFELLVSQRLPVLALVDLDIAIGPTAVDRLLRDRVPMVLLSYSSARLDEFSSRVPTLVQKPFSPRGIQKIVNGMLGRR